MSDENGLRQRIARAKGWKYAKSRTSYELHGLPVTPESWVWYTQSGDVYWDFELPNWPADIAAAWDLVEEMKTITPDEVDSFVMFSNYRDTWIFQRARGVPVRNIRVEAETAPLAISCAYLAWKEEL